MEIALFHRNPKKSMPQTSKALKNLSRTVEVLHFLSDNKRQHLLQQMREYSGLEAARYESLCTALIENLVLYCQKLPETMNSYYAHAGGLVDHALNRTEAALSLFQDFMVLENQSVSEPQKLWQYALFTAAILQNIGSLFVDFKINTFDAQGQFIKQWNPLMENLFKAGKQYDYELLKEPDNSFRHRLNLLLAKTIMPKSGFSWIASNPHVLMVWLALLNEDYQGAGTLGAILIRADAIALQRYFNELIDRHVKRSFGHAGSFIDGSGESILEKEQAIGLEFLQWLTKSLEEGTLILNKGPLIMVPGGLLMTQELFQLFVKESTYRNWETVQKGFLALGGLYVLDASGRANMRFEHGLNKTMISGIVFSKYALALPNAVKMQTGQSLTALDLIHRALKGTEYVQQVMREFQGLQKLNAQGNWHVFEQETHTLSPGANKGG